MNLLQHINSRLISLGVSSTIEDDSITVVRGDGMRPLRINSEEDYDKSFEAYCKARSRHFDEEQREFTYNTSFEVLVTHLAPSYSLTTDQYVLTDSAGNSVTVGRCSNAYSLAHLDSAEYEKFYNARIKNRFADSRLFNRKVSSLLWRPWTATYRHKGRGTPMHFRDSALSAIRSSLFKIAAEQNDCFTVWKSINRRVRSDSIEPCELDGVIPRAHYEQDVVSFYMVAKASPFPSQSFLAYYHVLEFYFLKVAEIKLHDRLASLLNSPSLRTDSRTLDRLISLVRSQDSRNDETEMLRSVLDRYVLEQDVIDFIAEFETKCDEKIYSKRRRVFGEDVHISPIKDHAIANAAKVLKHIRNAIVHSSDRYKREDCHIPLSATEGVIEEFIPLVRFFAEKIICGSAS